MKTVHLNGYIQVEKYPFIENSESHCNEGFVLFNELGEQFAFCWDNEQQCCENFLVDKSGYDHVLSFSRPIADVKSESWKRKNILKPC